MSRPIFIGWTWCLLDRGGFSNYLALIVQFAFADMRAMANMYLAGCAVLTQRHFLSLIMCPSFGTALLGMSSFRIWHITLFINIQNTISQSLRTLAGRGQRPVAVNGRARTGPGSNSGRQGPGGRSLNFSSPFHTRFPGWLFSRSSFFSISSTSLLQYGPPISSGLHIRCIGMLRLMNS
jgi:hypothetical protein